MLGGVFKAQVAVGKQQPGVFTPNTNALNT